MAINFLMKQTTGKGEAPIFVRIQHSKTTNGKRVPTANILTSTGISCPIDKWNLKRGGSAWAAFEAGEGKPILDKLKEIKEGIENRLTENNGYLKGTEAKEIISEVTLREVREREAEDAKRKQAEAEAEAKRKAEAERLTLNKFMTKFSETCDKREAARSGVHYTYNTAKMVRSVIKKFFEFQEETGRVYDFADINMHFYNDFTAYMESKGYARGYIGKCLGIYKTILTIAADEEGDKVTLNPIVFSKKFCNKRESVELIALTEDEVRRIMAVDLSGLPKIYEAERDIFAVGIWTAQRVGDYSTIDRLENVKIDAEDGLPYIELTQQKTKKKVLIPCRKELRDLLEKYPQKFPKVWPQHINDHIKVIAKMAGINDKITEKHIRGGKDVIEEFEKWERVCTHTARRTACTLMAESGMDKDDIMFISGHANKDTAMVDHYIKRSELSRMREIKRKYDYFK